VSALRLALPSLLLLWFLRRALAERVFLLGVPFLMYMAKATFFDRLKPFWVPGRLEPADHLMLWLVVVWLLYFDLLLPPRRRTVRRPAPVFGPRVVLPEEGVLLGLVALTALVCLLTVLRTGEPLAALVEAKGFAYLFAGYLLLRGILCHAGRESTVRFLVALVAVNTVAAALFVLHQGLHMGIYDVTEYQVITFMGQRLTRSFYFMPPLLGLAVAVSVARRAWSLPWLAVFAVTVAALWVSYTRSLLLIAVVEVAVVLGLRLLRGREAGWVLRRALAVASLVAVFAVLAWTLLPVQSRYLAARVESTAAAGSVLGDTNLQNRARKLTTTLAWVRPEGVALGQGFVNAAQEPRAGDIEWMSADLVWVPVLYRLGLLGVAAVAALFAAALWRAAALALRPPPRAAAGAATAAADQLSLVLAALIAGLALEGFVSWTFLNPERTPLGFWWLALLVAEAARRRAGGGEAG